MKEKRASRLFRLSLVSIILLTLSGCVVKTVYNYLDWFIRWEIKQYIGPFTDTQKAFIKPAVNDLHDWHRKTQLPLYVAFLEGFRTQLITPDYAIKPTTADQLHANTDEAQVLIGYSLEYAFPKVLKLLHSLDDKQIKKLEKSYKKDYDRFVKTYVDIPPEQQYKNREKDLLKNLKLWLGKLNKEQKTWVAQWARELKPYEKHTAIQQRIWQTELLESLKKRDNAEAFKHRIHKLMFYESEDWQAAAQPVIDFNQTLTLALIAQIINSLTPKQVKKMHKKLSNYEKIFKALASAD